MCMASRTTSLRPNTRSKQSSRNIKVLGHKVSLLRLLGIIFLIGLLTHRVLSIAVLLVPDDSAWHGVLHIVTAYLL